MKKIISFLALISCLSAISCTKDATCCNSEKEDYLFTGSIDCEILSKSSLTGENKVNWEYGDKVSINGVEYQASPKEDPTKAIFSKSSQDSDNPNKVNGLFKAYYPSSIYNNGFPTLPQIQTYTFGKANNIPMYAESASTTLPFKNICGILEICIKKEDAATVRRIKVSSGNKAMSGSFTVDSDSFYAELDNPDDPSKCVILDCGISGITVPESGSMFYIAIPPQTYRDIKIEISVDGTSYVKSMTTILNKEIKIKRNKIYYIDYEDNQIINPVESVTLSDSVLHLAVNDNYCISSSVLPDNADIKQLSWESDNTDIAIVSSNGVVTAVAEGECIITAKSHNNKKAKCQIKVVKNNSEFWNFAISKFDTNNDKVLNTEEIGAVTQIDASSSSLTRMDEIGRFNNLKKLNISGCNIESLDISSNDNLIWVYAKGCRYLNTITVKSIDYGAAIYFSKELTLKHGNNISTITEDGDMLYIPAPHNYQRVALNLHVNHLGLYNYSQISYELAQFLVSKYENIKELFDLSGYTYLHNQIFLTNTTYTDYTMGGVLLARTFSFNGTFGNSYIWKDGRILDILLVD